MSQILQSLGGGMGGGGMPGMGQKPGGGGGGMGGGVMQMLAPPRIDRGQFMPAGLQKQMGGMMQMPGRK